MGNNANNNNIRNALDDLYYAYRTLVELIEYYAGIDGFAEWERLGAIREWL